MPGRWAILRPAEPRGAIWTRASGASRTTMDSALRTFGLWASSRPVDWMRCLSMAACRRRTAVLRTQRRPPSSGHFHDPSQGRLWSDISRAFSDTARAPVEGSHVTALRGCTPAARATRHRTLDIGHRRRAHGTREITALRRRPRGPPAASYRARGSGRLRGLRRAMCNPCVVVAAESVWDSADQSGGRECGMLTCGRFGAKRPRVGSGEIGSAVGQNSVSMSTTPTAGSSAGATVLSPSGGPTSSRWRSGWSPSSTVTRVRR